VLTLILLSLSLQGPAEAGIAASWSSHTRGVRWDFNLTRETLARSPTWPDSDPWPPLSPRRAIELAWAQLGTLVGDKEGWQLRSVSLKQVGPQRTWIYVVDIAEPPPRPDGGVHSSIGMIVLMDGTTVAPIPARQPWPARPGKEGSLKPRIHR
jgi:hypothetical protein